MRGTILTYSQNLYNLMLKKLQPNSVQLWRCRKLHNAPLSITPLHRPFNIPHPCVNAHITSSCIVLHTQHNYPGNDGEPTNQLNPMHRWFDFYYVSVPSSGRRSIAEMWQKPCRGTEIWQKARFLHASIKNLLCLLISLGQFLSMLN